MPLIDDVADVCRRLADGGWRDLLLLVTDGDLDITAPDLRQELARPLARIDRTVPGFEDFAKEGDRGIEPSVPARSLLYHALASSWVRPPRSTRRDSSCATVTSPENSRPVMPHRRSQQILQDGPGLPGFVRASITGQGYSCGPRNSLRTGCPWSCGGLSASAVRVAPT